MQDLRNKETESEGGTRGLDLVDPEPQSRVDVIFIMGTQLRKKCDQRGGALDIPVVSAKFCLWVH